jgi:mono/diheme cytochrome c family protein
LKWSEGSDSQKARGEGTIMRFIVLFGAFLSVVTAVGAKGQSPVDQTQFPSTYVPSGDTMYKKYCSACHGVDGKGGGPVASLLKVPPPDLTTLGKRHGGKFPYEYVSSVLRFGPGISAHGSADMPTWGPIFNFLDKYNERSVEQRIKNLTGYLASLQEWVIAGQTTPLFQTTAARAILTLIPQRD